MYLVCPPVSTRGWYPPHNTISIDSHITMILILCSTQCWQSQLGRFKSGGCLAPGLEMLGRELMTKRKLGYKGRQQTPHHTSPVSHVAYSIQCRSQRP